MSFNAVSDDGASFFHHVDRNWRAQTRPLDDFAAGENMAARSAYLQRVKDRTCAWAGHHGVGSAVAVLLRESAQVRHEFQVAVPIRFAQSKGPKVSAGKADYY